MNTMNTVVADVFSYFTKKIGETRTVTRSALPVVSQDFIWDYGLKQYMADCHASIKRENYRDQSEFDIAVKMALAARESALMEGRVGKSDKSIQVAKIVAALSAEQLAALGLVRA